MRCRVYPNYERCEQSDELKDDCCHKCLAFYECIGADEREDDYFNEVRHNL